ncbi:sulfotransferase domain protein [bacterium BMS3Abin15]|nr:sulfotransferase domain protein [bacterium BMS3Abin15]
MEGDKNRENTKVDFIGIGSAKCATTWVYRCLIEHPQICGPYVKELNFFVTKKNPMSEKSFEHYKLLYNEGVKSYIKRFKHCPVSSVKGEISVSYLSDPGAARIISEHFPKVKVLVFLRDPVKRAYSYYWFARKFTIKEKSSTFEEALNDKSSYELYIDRGMYYRHLKKYYDYFPRENIGVFFVDDLKKDATSFIQSVYSFLGVDDRHVPESVNKRANAAREVRLKFVRRFTDYAVDKFYLFIKYTRLHFIKNMVIKLGLQKLIYHIFYKVNVSSFQKPPIDSKTERKLRNIFREDIENLEKLLQRDLNTWK